MKYNTGELTTSFSDTIRVTRHMEDLSEKGEFSLRVVDGGMLEYVQVFESARKGENRHGEMDGPSL
jgi:hypothetical protein